jgi:hypothetical protein
MNDRNMFSKFIGTLHMITWAYTAFRISLRYDSSLNISYVDTVRVTRSVLTPRIVGFDPFL